MLTSPKLSGRSGSVSRPLLTSRNERLVTSQPFRIRHSLQCNSVSCRPKGYLLFFCQVAYRNVRFRDRSLQLTVHLLVRPAILLEVLGPFVVADRYTTGVGEEVGDHRNAPLFEDAVGSRRG